MYPFLFGDTFNAPTPSSASSHADNTNRFGQTPDNVVINSGSGDENSGSGWDGRWDNSDSEDGISDPFSDWDDFLNSSSDRGNTFNSSDDEDSPLISSDMDDSNVAQMSSQPSIGTYTKYGYCC